MSAYHKKQIKKGELGHASKIREEYQEFKDAFKQGNPVLELCELADLIGAIEAYTINYYNIYIEDLVKMMKLTKRSFESGERQ